MKRIGIGSFSRLREKAGDEGVRRPIDPLPQAGEGAVPALLGEEQLT